MLFVRTFFLRGVCELDEVDKKNNNCNNRVFKETEMASIAVA